MPHPHEYLLKEFKISIDKLVPLTPHEVVAEANQLYDELSANAHASEKQIHDALVHVGRKEFPYRKAYEELCANDEEQRLQKLVFDRLDDAVQAKVENVTQHGVHVLDYVNSPLFEEQLTADERYQVEQAILLAHDDLNKQCNERAIERKKNYEELVARWRAEEERLQGLIDQLKGMADRDVKWRDEILGKAAQLEEGWSIVERDPSEEEVKKELEYWSTVLAESEDDAVDSSVDAVDA
ncbi:hypothetical protein HYS28_03640 [Candidatus Uhrbacteria bacterium]|nr:hypothetical protein [Candidatus Uhrbacteria bacterium]